MDETRKERGILFSAEMVLKLLSGEKTQTRRLVAFRPSPVAAPFVEGLDPDSGLLRWGSGVNKFVQRCPHGAPGDRLWVKETWGGDDMCGVAYRADHPDWPRFQGDGEQSDGPWRPSIFMPRKFSRITLEITEARVQRLQDISGADALAEGLAVPPVDYSVPEDPRVLDHERECEAHQRFIDLWESINGPRSWAANPWVWALTFRRIPQETNP